MQSISDRTNVLSTELPSGPRNQWLSAITKRHTFPHRFATASLFRHPAFIDPGALEHFIEQMVIAADVLAVDLVVAAHDRAGLRALDRDLEGEQVELAVRNVINDRILPVAICLVAVERVVLERRDNTLALDTVDLLGCENGAEIGIFGVVLEVTPIAGVAREVAPAGKLDVESADPRLAADRLAALSYKVRVKTRPERNQRRERRRRRWLRGEDRIVDQDMSSSCSTCRRCPLAPLTKREPRLAQ